MSHLILVMMILILDKNFRDTMIAQFKQDLFNKNFSLQDASKRDQIDTLQNRIKFWLNLIDMGGPILDNLYNYDNIDDGLDLSVRGAEIIPENRELEKLLDILRNQSKTSLLKILANHLKKLCYKQN